MSCISHDIASIHCCLVVTCWKRADLLALVGDNYCIFVTFPFGILGQVWYLIVLLPDLCRLSYLINGRSDPSCQIIVTSQLNPYKNWKEMSWRLCLISVWGRECPDMFYLFILVINVFHRWPYGPPLEAIGPEGSNCF